MHDPICCVRCASFHLVCALIQLGEAISVALEAIVSTKASIFDGNSAAESVG
jgi:hypothetical protein